MLFAHIFFKNEMHSTIKAAISNSALKDFGLWQQLVFSGKKTFWESFSRSYKSFIPSELEHSFILDLVDSYLWLNIQKSRLIYWLFPELLSISRILLQWIQLPSNSHPSKFNSVKWLNKHWEAWMKNVNFRIFYHIIRVAFVTWINQCGQFFLKHYRHHFADKPPFIPHLKSSFAN